MIFLDRAILMAAGMVVFATGAAQAQTYRGLVGIKSIHDAYLQAHTDGELHASNFHRNEEETWLLIEVDAAKHIYAFQNWRNQRLITKEDNGCAPANRPLLGPWEKWELVSGKKYGIANAVAFKSTRNGEYLFAKQPGNDFKSAPDCGGEVAAPNASGPGDAHWGGWWRVETATYPTGGRDPISVITGVATNLNAADIALLLTAIGM